MQRAPWLLASAAFLVTIATPVLAQTEPVPPRTIEENAPAQKPDLKGTNDDNKSLSEKLKDNEGVIKPPPAIDPEIRKPPPEDTNEKMPVIIPPGEPGGDQSVQPK